MKSARWELATLIDIMLLGNWIEMKSVMGNPENQLQPTSSSRSAC